LTTNSLGHPTAAFPIDELAERLNITAAQVEIRRSWTRIEWLGGYWSHLRLPRPQWPAIAAGSVFEISLAQSVSLQPQQLSDIERSGLGLKRNEGFGQIAFQTHAPATGQAQNIHLKSIKKEKTQKPNISSDSPPETLMAILSSHLQRYTSRILQEKALEFAKSSSSGLSRALIGRLSLLFRQNPLSDALKQIKYMKQAGEALKKKQCEVKDLWFSHQPSKTMQLEDFLAHLCQKAPEQTKHWLRNALSQRGSKERSLRALLDDETLQDAILERASSEAGERLIKEFLLIWLGEMRKKIE
jgi:hypothetical protein